MTSRRLRPLPPCHAPGLEEREAGAEDGAEALHLAASEGFVLFVHHLIEQKAEPTANSDEIDLDQELEAIATEFMDNRDSLLREARDCERKCDQVRFTAQGCSCEEQASGFVEVLAS